MISIASIAALTTALAGGPVAAFAASPSPSPASAVVSTVEGVVDNSTGSPVDAGWAVSLWAQPNASTLGALKVGDVVPSREVSSTTTDASGHFSLATNDSTLPAEYRGVDGSTNYTVQSDAQGQHQSYALTLTPAIGAQRTAVEVAGAASTRTIAVPTFPGLKAPQSSPAMKRASVQPDVLCNQYHVVAAYTKRHTQVGEAYTSSGSSATFAYTAGSSTSFGEGFGSNSSATFSASGTTSSSSSRTQSFGAISNGTGRKWVTGYSSQKQEKDCDDGSKLYIYQATDFNGGDYSESSVAFSSNSHCVPERSGDGFSTTQTNSTAYKFGSGFEVSGDIGINLTAQTGWDAKAAISFKFSKTVQLCGASDLPGGTPRRLKTIAG